MWRCVELLFVSLAIALFSRTLVLSFEFEVSMIIF